MFSNLALRKTSESQLLLGRKPLTLPNQIMEKISTHLRDMEVGSVVTIVGYDQAYGGYKGKLTSIGLTPNTELILLHLGFPDAPIEVKVGNSRLSLSQQEADALLVEEAE